jgi:hypothetical protein
MFSYNFSFLSSRNVNDQVPHSYKTTGKIKVLRILKFKFFYSSSKTKYSAPNYNKHFLTSICSFFLLDTINVLFIHQLMQQ